jgi:hypothetical protein
MFGSHQFEEMKKQLEQIGHAALKKVDDQYVRHTLHFSYLTDVSLLLLYLIDIMNSLDGESSAISRV